MTSAEWIDVDQHALTQSHQFKKGGIVAKIAPSPFALPTGARVYQDATRSGAEMRYIASEPLRCAALRDESRIFFGRNSHRIYKIDVQAPSSDDAGSLVRKLAEAIDSFLRVYDDSSVKSNAEVFLVVVRRLLAEAGGKISKETK